MYEHIMKTIDHTLLKPTATWAEIQTLCDQAVHGQAASICLPPCYVAEAKAYLHSYLQADMPVCTVIGFPNGYQTKGVKFNETLEAIKDGADEIDMVINLANVKNGEYHRVVGEIQAVKAACGSKILKVIVEACYLTEAEKIRLCEIVTDVGADYIKTSTGFGPGGATVADVRLFKAHIGPEVKIKAAGGIKTIEQAQALLDAGASRLGASSLLTLLQEKV